MKYDLICPACGKIYVEDIFFNIAPRETILNGKKFYIFGCHECMKTPNKLQKAYDRIDNNGPVIPEKKSRG